MSSPYATTRFYPGPDEVEAIATPDDRQWQLVGHHRLHSFEHGDYILCIWQLVPQYPVHW